MWSKAEQPCDSSRMKKVAPDKGEQERDGQMNEIADIRGRLEAALDRIDVGLGALQPVRTDAIDPAMVAALQTELADEKIATAQLEERIRVLKDRQDARVAALEAELVQQRGLMAGFDSELQRLRQSNADLRDLTGQLRAALTEEVAEPELVNRAMLAEIEALRATRAADLAEATAIYAELRPLIEEA
jgi:septal ring factor EnvC (AmiA/AmiB activator)